MKSPNEQILAEKTNLMELGQFLTFYGQFHDKVEKTPAYELHLAETIDGVEYEARSVMPTEYQRRFFKELHASMGMVGEAGEILEIYKKRLFGKNKPIDQEKVKEEMGDLFWYFFLQLKATGIPLREIVEGNILKLSDRYGVPI